MFGVDIIILLSVVMIGGLFVFGLTWIIKNGTWTNKSGIRKLAKDLGVQFYEDDGVYIAKGNYRNKPVEIKAHVEKNSYKLGSSLWFVNVYVGNKNIYQEICVRPKYLKFILDKYFDFGPTIFRKYIKAKMSRSLIFIIVFGLVLLLGFAYFLWKNQLLKSSDFNKTTLIELLRRMPFNNLRSM